MRVLAIPVEVPSPLSGGIATSTSLLYALLEKYVDLTMLISSRYAKKNNKKLWNSIVIPAIGKSILEIISFGKNAAKYINKNHKNYDVIHLHLPLGLGVLHFLEKEVMNKVLVTFHTTYVGYNNMFKLIKLNEIKYIDDFFGKFGYYSVMNRIERKLSKKIIFASAVSKGVANELISHYELEKVEVIPNGIDQTIERNEIIPDWILFVGRLTVQKGLIDLLKAIEVLKNEGYKFNLNICGRGYLEKFISSYIHKKKLEKFVNLNGFVSRDRLVYFYQHSNLGVIPSLYEGFPMVGLEMASAGMSIVATDASRIQEIVCEENKDFIVRSRDFRTLANKIANLLENIDLPIQIGAKNKAKCRKEYDINNIVKKYLKFYYIISSYK